MSTDHSLPVIRIGVVGLQRGAAFAKDSKELAIKLVAVCGRNEQKLHDFQQRNPDVTVYTDYDQFLQHDLDAVIIANHFHQHAPLAIKALQAGKHVLSEIAACKTIQEGVQLARAVEQSGKIYMIGENYPYTSANLEMKRQYQRGVIGEVKYAEGEYVHMVPLEAAFGSSPGLDHWRNHCPSTYYSSHSLAPLMHMTDTMPVRVNALSTSDPEQEKTKVKVGDPTSVILCRMDNGAVFRLVGGNMAGRRSYYRLHGFKGMMDTVGKLEDGLVHIVRNTWELSPDDPEEITYKSKFASHADLASKTGHGGGDFWTLFHFAEAIRTGVQPYLNVYRGLAMIAVGILAWKSALQDGASFEVPDFSKEEVRRQHEQDDWSPWPEDRRPGQPWPSIRGQIIPSAAAVAYAEKIWAKKK